MLDQLMGQNANQSARAEPGLAARRDPVAAVGWGLAANLIFSVVLASGKFGGAESPALQIVFLRYLGGFISLALVLRVVNGQRLEDTLSSARPGLHMGRAVAGAAGVVCALWAATRMPLADASSINLTNSVWFILWAALFLGERIRLGQALAILVCLLGALIVVRGNAASAQAGTTSYLLPAAVAAIGAALSGIEMLLVKKMSAHERASTMVLFVNGLGALLLSIPALLLWHPLDLVGVAGFMLLGPLAIIGQLCNVRGFRLADASLVGAVIYSSVIFATLIGFLVFDERPSMATLAGCGLIIAGGLTIAHLARRHSGRP